MDKFRKNLEKHMKALCLDCGPRQCGSVGERMAADYIENEFKSLGYETVREGYPVIGWNCTEFSLFNVTKNREVPCATAGYFSNPVDVTGQLVWLRGEEINEIEKIDIKGKLCFVEAQRTKFGGNMNALSEFLDERGAAGAIFISLGHTSHAPSTKLPRSPLMKKMGVATVSQDGAFDIYANRNDVYRLVVKSEKFDTTAYNVIAKRPGTTKKGVIGAHYDTAPFIQGAQDDAAGIASLIELARVFKDKYTDWSFDFCAFSAEEYIVDNYPEGSKDYYRRHGKEDIKWYLNIDGIGTVIAERILELAHRERLPEKFDIKSSFVRETTRAGDDKVFSCNGVPTVWLKSVSLYALLHTELDNIDNIDMDRMAETLVDYVKLFDTLADFDYKETAER